MLGQALFVIIIRFLIKPLTIVLYFMTLNFKLKPRVLVADDQMDILRSAQLLFESEDIDAVTCTTPAEVLYYMQQQEFDVVLLDLNYQRDTTSGSEGLALIKAIKAKNDTTAIVAMTAWASVDVAVEAMKLGAKDFITKPWDVERLLSIIKNQCELSRSIVKQNKLAEENQLLRAVNNDDLICQSPAMQEVMTRFKQVAQSDANIFLSGENGTGKSKLADICHQMSHRAYEPFISVNMGGLAASVFESEMFGHQKGAYTGATADRIGRFELADSGTLFLDEIANLAPAHQSTMLRLLENGQFERLGSSKTRRCNVRIIAATNSDIPALIQQGKFREDLFYRINTVPIRIPALRERLADIIPLARQCINKFQHKYQKNDLKLTNQAEQLLLAYHWPGNVRELTHSIERAVLFAGEHHIQAQDLGLSPSIGQPIKMAEKTLAEMTLAEMTLAEMEVKLLKKALHNYTKQPEKMALSLGLSRSALYRKFAKYELTVS